MYSNIVSGVLQNEDQLLLCLRKNTTHYADYWAFPVGHVEFGENTVDALRRELFEEIGIQLLDCERLITLYDNEQKIRHAVFKVTEWRGEIENREPELCEQVQWFPLKALPQPLTPACLSIVENL